LAALDNERQSFISHWRDISDFLLPRRGRFLLTDRNNGSKKNGSIIDSTGTLALRTLSSGMMAGITSPARPWFRLSTQDPRLADENEVRVWLDRVVRLLRDIFNRSNLYNVLPVLYEELGSFGTGAMLVTEDYEDVIRCYPMTVGEYYLANNDRLEVDTFYREYSLTVGQLISEFGEDKVSDKVRELWQRGSVDEWIDVVHAIEPNGRPDVTSRLSKDKPFKSVKFEKGGTRNLLSEMGFDEFPVMAPRWHLLSTDVYGRSPGMDSLGDIKQLQMEQKRKQQAIAKMVNPPLTGPGTLRNQPISSLPGGITFADTLQGQQGLRPTYEVNPRIAELMQDIQQTQDRIRQGFYADLFQMMTLSDRRQVTAREIDERHEEKLLMLGPVLERLHNELLDPLIDRTFAIAERAGIVPEPPEVLQETPIKVEYISMLAQAQQAIGIGAIERTLAFVGQMAAVSPTAVDKINTDKTIDEYAEMQGTPPEIIVPNGEVEKIRKARAQQEQQMQQMAALQQAAEGAKTLSDTDTTEGNALADMLGGSMPQ